MDTSKQDLLYAVLQIGIDDYDLISRKAAGDDPADGFDCVAGRH